MKPVNGIHNGCFCFIVERRSRFIQNQNLRILKQSPGNPDTLTLSSGKTDSPLPDSRIQPFRKPLHELVKLRLLQCLPYLVIINFLIRNAECHILSDRCINHENSLRNIADIFQPLLIVFPDFHAVSQNTSFLDIQKPQKDVNNCSFSRSGGSHHSYRTSHRNFHIRMIENEDIRIRIFIDNIL